MCSMIWSCEPLKWYKRGKRDQSEQPMRIPLPPAVAGPFLFISRHIHHESSKVLELVLPSQQEGPEVLLLSVPAMITSKPRKFRMVVPGTCFASIQRGKSRGQGGSYFVEVEWLRFHMISSLLFSSLGGPLLSDITIGNNVPRTK